MIPRVVILPTSNVKNNMDIKADGYISDTIAMLAKRLPHTNKMSFQ
ncbi:Uncharacterised protein [Vibrio cholerae]|nr:Uncharacterised protein [Vibrio cholerae]